MPSSRKVAIGSVWRHKSNRWPSVRYRAVGYRPDAPELVLLERVDRPERKPTWEHETWVVNTLDSLEEAD